MKKILICFFCGVSALSGATTPQYDSLTLKDIYTGTMFAAKGIDALRSTADGRHYTLLERDGDTTRINRYDYATGEKTATLFSSEGLAPLAGKRISSYQLSPDESRILIGTDAQSIFRRSYTARYYVYDTADRSLTAVTDGRIQQALFSPDATKVAYSQDNNLYYKDLASGQIVRVTSDGKAGSIINGTSDWVYEEEFAIVRLFDWSPSGKYLAYVRFDESEVPVYGMDIYNRLYPNRDTFKYPKAGARNSEVSLWIYSLDEKSARQVDVPHQDEFYIPRIRWTTGADRLAFYVMPRLQNRLDVYGISVPGWKTELIYKDKDDAYINLNDATAFLKDGSVAFVSERDGYAHLYLKDPKGKTRQITRGHWQITAFYGIDEKTGTAYFQSTSQGPENRDICAVSLRNGKIRRLSSATGTNSAAFSKGFAYYINTFNSATTPALYTLNDPRDGKVVKILQDNDALKARVDSLHIPGKEFSTLTTEDGQQLQMWTMRPVDFDSTKTYPLLMYVYGGPGSQQVLNTWYTSQDFWFAYLTQKGYIVACVDGRGTGGRGAAFEKTIYKRMGELELHDQKKAAEALGRLPYIDKECIGIFGWSFGGYMASLAATRGGDTWRAAVAVAPVTSWRFYDSIYTERYLSTPQENLEGYDKNSPLIYAEDLSSRFLLIHGTADDNVHLQNTMEFSALLIAANRPFEQMVYPDKNHSIYGGLTRLHLFTKITDFLLQNL